jgi:hypothetical protein
MDVIGSPKDFTAITISPEKQIDKNGDKWDPLRGQPVMPISPKTDHGTL